MDSIDKAIIRELMRDGRATWAALGEATGLSAAAVAQRVKRLEASDVILRYAAIVDADSVDAGLLAYVAVRFADPKHRAAFLRVVGKLAWVQECHHTAGEMDYLLKVRCRGTKELERLITVELKDKCKVTESRTSIVLASSKETTEIFVAD